MSNKSNISIDERGYLVAFDDIKEFDVKRFFFIECKQGMWRGDHYHKNVTQKIYVVYGKLEYILENENQKIAGFLSQGQFITQEINTKFIFCSMTPTTKIVILCDNTYDENDYYK